MDLIADRGRRVAVEELNTSRLLAHASGAPPREVAARCIHGADIDRRAVAAALSRL